jgi:hypothetical protein
MFIGLLGILFGVAINEFVRRWIRIESYAGPVFEKRLTIYEGLHARIREGSNVAREILENQDLDKTQRHELISVAILDIASYCDENELYINEDLALHCTALFMGVEEIPDLPEGPQREEKIEEHREELLAAMRMIRKEAGIADLDKLFRSITKPKHSSAVIEYYHEVLKQKGKRGKWEDR